MGYTTEFEGHFNFNRKVSKKLKDFINDYSETRHYRYDTEKIKKMFPFWRILTYKGDMGVDGANIANPYTDERIAEKIIPRIDYNNSGQCPSLWCQWVINSEKQLVWDGCEKFYEYDKWLEFLIKNFFQPDGYILNGVNYYFGEENTDFGYLIVDNNKVFQYNALQYSLEYVKKKHENNQEILNTLTLDNKTQKKLEQYYYEWGNYEYDR